ncbi:MAG TPA: hypothetical protein VJ302_27945 [Blastocatellia bacterium]|nr:hypothetical protein [Blastocatellia bacterium]
MPGIEPRELQADSVLDLLIAQCADLESLLALARREAQAAETRNFDEILRVAEERATLGERLEIYHRQIAEMRLRLGELAEPALQTDAAKRTSALAAQIIAEDARTYPLLLAARSELLHEQQQLDRSQRAVNAYLQDAPRLSVACDRRA